MFYSYAYIHDFTSGWPSIFFLSRERTFSVFLINSTKRFVYFRTVTNTASLLNQQFVLLLGIHPILEADPEIEEGEPEEESHRPADRGEDVEEVDEDVLLNDGLLDPLEVEIHPRCVLWHAHVVTLPPSD